MGGWLGEMWEVEECVGNGVSISCNQVDDFRFHWW